MGLKDSKSIARIVVHPTDPKTAYVAAMGDLWNFGGERGCYKTTDAGKNWTKLTKGLPPGEMGRIAIAVDFKAKPTRVYASMAFARSGTQIMT